MYDVRKNYTIPVGVTNKKNLLWELNTVELGHRLCHSSANSKSNVAELDFTSFGDFATTRVVATLFPIQIFYCQQLFLYAYAAAESA